MSEIAPQESNDMRDGEYDEGLLLASFDQDYAVCEPSPRHMNSLFEGVRETQRRLEGEVYSSFERATYEGDSLVHRFNKAMKRHKLLGKPVYLSGRNIHIPSINIDPVTGGAVVHIDDSRDEDMEESLLDRSEIAGYFKGVHYQLLPVGSDGQSLDLADRQLSENGGGYKIGLRYQVKIGAYRHLYGKTELCAAAGVASSTLEYADDRSLRTIREALEQLLSIESETAAVCVNEINYLLANRELAFKAVKQVASLVRILCETTPLTAVQSDALIDLLGSYIPPQGQYAMEVTEALSYEGIEGGRGVKLLTSRNGSTLSYRQQISDIILAPGYQRDATYPDTVRFDTGTREPYFVIESDVNDRIVHVPMRQLTTFRLDD